MSEQCLGQNRPKAFAHWLGPVAEANPRCQGSAHNARRARGHRAPAEACHWLDGVKSAAQAHGGGGTPTGHGVKGSDSPRRLDDGGGDGDRLDGGVPWR
jgi:hypothetical protein